MHLTERFRGLWFLELGHQSRRRDVIDLLAAPTEALSRIRQKAATGRALSRAEWTVVAHVAQHGLETVAMTKPNRLSPDCFIPVLDAFSAVYDVRTVPHTRHDPYYLATCLRSVDPPSPSMRHRCPRRCGQRWRKPGAGFVSAFPDASPG